MRLRPKAYRTKRTLGLSPYREKLEASTNPVREKRVKPHLETHVDDNNQTISPHSTGYILAMPCYALLCDALLYHVLLSYACFCCALLRLASPSFALLCLGPALLRCTLLQSCFAVLCCVMLVVALLGIAMCYELFSLSMLRYALLRYDLALLCCVQLCFPVLCTALVRI